jgi:hypothetical protein
LPDNSTIADCVADALKSGHGDRDTGRPRFFDRSEALDRAIRLFRAEGHAFGGKRALFDEAVAADDRDYGGPIDAAVNENPPPARPRDLAAGFDISVATAWRRARETIRLLAAQAPGTRDALGHVKRTGAAFMILDGTPIHIDRPCYSGRHNQHGMNFQAVADARGNLLWVSGTIRGSIHDGKAARTWQTSASGSLVGLFACAHVRLSAPLPRGGTPTAGAARERLHGVAG